MVTAPGRVSCAQLMANFPKGTVDVQEREGGARMWKDRPPRERIRAPLFGFNLYPLCRLQCNIWAWCRPDLIMCWELAFAAIPRQQ